MQQHRKNDLLYLLYILEAAEKIKIYVAPFSEPLAFFDSNDGVEFNASLMMLTQIGEQVTKISNELKAAHPTLNWNEIKGFRNRAVHDYTGIDRFITFDIAKNHIPGLKESVSSVIRQELEQGYFDWEEFQIAKTSQYLKHVDFSFINET